MTSFIDRVKTNTYTITPIDSPIEFDKGSDKPFTFNGSKNDAVKQWYYQNTRETYDRLNWEEGHMAVVNVKIENPDLGMIGNFPVKILPAWTDVDILPASEPTPVEDMLTLARSLRKEKELYGKLSKTTINSIKNI